jgi:hypothetical protein
MTFLASPLTFRLVRRDLSAQLDITPQSKWSFSTLRSKVGEIKIDTDPNEKMSQFIPWSDLIEVRQGPTVIMRYILRGIVPNGPSGSVRVTGAGMVGQLRRRNQPDIRTFLGPAIDVWREVFVIGSSIEPLLIAPQADGSDQGETINIAVNQYDSLFDLHESLAGSYVVYAEHSGGLETRAVGDEVAGPPLRTHWLVGETCAPPEFNSDTLANEFPIRYGSDGASITYPPGGAADPNRQGARLQGPPLSFIEIDNSDEAHTIGKKVYDVFSVPQIVLPELELNTQKVKWGWLVPGRAHRSSLPGSEGVMLNLATVTLAGVGPSVSSAKAKWDRNSADGFLSRSNRGLGT